MAQHFWETTLHMPCFTSPATGDRMPATRPPPCRRHFGVVRALLESNLLPRVVSGSSAGSIGGWAGRVGLEWLH